MQGLKNWRHRRKTSASPSPDTPAVDGAVLDTTLVSKGFFVEEDRVNCAVLLQSGQSILYGTNNGVFFQRLCGDLTGAPIKVLDLKRVNHLGILKEPELLVVSTTDESVVIFPCKPTEGFNAITPDKGIKISKAISLLKTGHSLGAELLCLVKSQKLSSTINVLRPSEDDKAASSGKRPKSQQLTFKTAPRSSSLRVFKHIEVRDVQYGNAVQVIRGDNFRRVFEDNEPSKGSTGTSPEGNQPIVMVSNSQVVLLRRGPPPREPETRNEQDTAVLRHGVPTAFETVMTRSVPHSRIPSPPFLVINRVDPTPQTHRPSSNRAKDMSTSQLVAARRHSDFAKSPRGKTIRRLLVISLAVSTVSFALNMIRFASGSIFIIPAAWALTLLSHTTLLCRLAKYNKRTTTPPCDTPPFLKHAFNISILIFISLVWLAGGITVISIVPTFIRYMYMSVVEALDIVAGVLGIIESGLIMTLVVYFWKALSREGYSGSTR
ncbi:RHO1 GDP-GTP exchange protein 2, partial [Ceratobasidium sp. 392]